MAIHIKTAMRKLPRNCCACRYYQDGFCGAMAPPGKIGCKVSVTRDPQCPLVEDIPKNARFDTDKMFRKVGYERKNANGYMVYENKYGDTVEYVKHIGKSGVVIKAGLNRIMVSYNEILACASMIEELGVNKENGK